MAENPGRTSVQCILVPGLGLDERSLRRLRARVPAGVVLLPGMGGAEPVPSLEELADRLLAALGEGPVVLVGHSQSCQVVVAAAARDRRVVAVVLLGPTTDPRLRSAWGLTRRWLRTALAEPWWLVPLVVAQWWSTGPRAMAALWRAAAPDDVRRRLSAVAVPVTVLRGTRDRLCPHDWAARLAAAAPQGRLVEVPGAAHMTPMTHPDAVAAVLPGPAASR
ncbi:alpha/beta fold hydrolase [Blastococcus tunisiensis]|uniref:Pimeloyl-ACP methyl ester carboxylesterase n=1 Tax=Blastococcus tunisiensis TaxID=1798228 RepID=A0A1I2BL14_9ACTN|nr:alpha/beta hydrolase [Blastococcus sp. DSM 46838]SFE56607.1 Pimeloyl-ACP methyl ester carboxylesterase [Blastococcus sp. DSM 46838]